jgi:hypothetical protein
VPGVASQGFGIFAQDAQRQRIGEDAALLQHLVNGAMDRRGPGCAAGLSRLHREIPV